MEQVKLIRDGKRVSSNVLYVEVKPGEGILTLPFKETFPDGEYEVQKDDGSRIRIRLLNIPPDKSALKKDFPSPKKASFVVI